MLHETFTDAGPTFGKARSDDAAISSRQYGTSMLGSFDTDWVHHLVRSRFTSDTNALVERISVLVAGADRVDPTGIAEDIRTIIESTFRRFLRASTGRFKPSRGSCARRRQFWSLG